MTFCAICTSERGPFFQRPLGKDDALVSVCRDCDEDAPIATYGPERAYEGAAAAPTHVEMTKALRRLQGDERYERESAFNRELSPIGQSEATKERIRKYRREQSEWTSYLRESARRRRTGAVDIARPLGLGKRHG